jgi:Mn-containing catalase
MFYHAKKLQYRVRVDRPDPLYARQLQELIGGKYGEMRVMTQYLFQGWNLRGDLNDEQLRKLKDMLLDTGTEEIAHIEMLATCVSLLLEGASPEQQAKAAQTNPVVYATLGGMNPQHMIVSGLGALPADSAGNPFRGDYAIASGNVVADLYANATAEMQGRLQACRLYEMTTDSGVRDMLSFLIARDRMHQNQWLAAIEELGGVTKVLPVPADFPVEQEVSEHGYRFWDLSKDPDGLSSTGRWAQGRSIDGKGEFSHIADPQPLGEEPHLAAPPPTIHSAIPGGSTSAEKPVKPPQKESQPLGEKVKEVFGGGEETTS